MIVITLNSENPPPIQLQALSQSFSLRTMKLTAHLTMLMECENPFNEKIFLLTWLPAAPLTFTTAPIQLHICLGQLVTPQRLNFLNWPLDEVYACLAVQCNCPWYSLQKWKIGHWWETPKISPNSHFPILKCCNSKEHIRGGWASYLKRWPTLLKVHFLCARFRHPCPHNTPFLHRIKKWFGGIIFAIV